MEGWHSSVFTCVFFRLPSDLCSVWNNRIKKYLYLKNNRKRLGQILQTSLYFAARLFLYFYDVLVRDGG